MLLTCLGTTAGRAFVLRKTYKRQEQIGDADRWIDGRQRRRDITIVGDGNLSEQFDLASEVTRSLFEFAARRSIGLMPADHRSLQNSLVRLCSQPDPLACRPTIRKFLFQSSGITLPLNRRRHRHHRRRLGLGTNHLYTGNAQHLIVVVFAVNERRPTTVIFFELFCFVFEEFRIILMSRPIRSCSKNKGPKVDKRRLPDLSMCWWKNQDRAKGEVQFWSQRECRI